MQSIDPQGLDKFSPRRPDWWDLCRGQLDIAIHTKSYISCGPQGLEIFSCFFPLQVRVIGPQGMASLDSRDLISRICVVEH